MRETEERNAAGTLDGLPALEVVRRMNEEDRSVAAAVGGVLPEVARVVDVAVQKLGDGGRLVYVGAGTSGRLGVLDAAECVPTFGVSPGTVVGVVAGGASAFQAAEEGAEDDVVAGREAMEELGIGGGDLVVGISASGRTPYTLAAIEEARDRGAPTAGLVNVAGSEISRAADHPLEVTTGAEVLAGSTRLKAGTSQKLVLNMISTGAMVGLGYVYENLMVGVLPRNAKLRDRAERMVREITGRDERESRHALECSGYDVRLAVLLIDGAESVEDARAQLQQAGGSLRKARTPPG